MNRTTAAPQILRAVLAAYKEAISTTGHKGNLPIHYGAKYANSPPLLSIHLRLSPF